MSDVFHRLIDRLSSWSDGTRQEGPWPPSGWRKQSHARRSYRGQGDCTATWTPWYCALKGS